MEPQAASNQTAAQHFGQAISSGGWPAPAPRRLARDYGIKFAPTSHYRGSCASIAPSIA